MGDASCGDHACRGRAMTWLVSGRCVMRWMDGSCAASFDAPYAASCAASCVVMRYTMHHALHHAPCAMCHAQCVSTNANSTTGGRCRVMQYGRLRQVAATWHAIAARHSVRDTGKNDDTLRQSFWGWLRYWRASWAMCGWVAGGCLAYPYPHPSPAL